MSVGDITKPLKQTNPKACLTLLSIYVEPISPFIVPGLMVMFELDFSVT